MSRLAKIANEGGEPELVEIEAHNYLVDMLIDPVGGLGPIRIDGSGNLRAVDWEDLTHFRLNMKVDLTAWEAQALKGMSLHYLSGLRSGADPLARSPLSKSRR